MPLYETYVHWPTNIGSLGVGTYVICLMNIGSFIFGDYLAHSSSSFPVPRFITRWGLILTCCGLDNFI